jgi:hypothetical protein
MAWISIGRAFVILARWEREGIVLSGWVPGSEPRRRV